MKLEEMFRRMVLPNQCRGGSREVPGYSRIHVEAKKIMLGLMLLGTRVYSGTLPEASNPRSRSLRAHLGR